MELLTEVERIKSVMGLILEKKKKLTRDEKFYWISQNMGEWIFDEVVTDFKKIQDIPFYGKYRQYLKLKTKVNIDDLESVVDSLSDYYKDFLNVMDAQDSEDVVDEFKKYYPSIAQKIARYERKEFNPNEKRGRKKLVRGPKITSAIKSGRFTGDMSRLKPLSSVTPKSEPQPEPEVKPQGAKRGRKPLGGEFTSQEVNRWKLEGVEQLSKIEKRIDKYETESTKLTNVIIRLQKDLDRRKKFFGVDQEQLNESIEKIKLDFKRFI
jgi:hypothetical protein